MTLVLISSADLASFVVVQESFPLNSMQELVRSWLFCEPNFSYSVSFRCMFGVGVEVWTENFLYRSIEGQTHFNTFSMSTSARLSLAPEWTNREYLSYQNFHTDSNHALETYWTWRALHTKQPTPRPNHQLTWTMLYCIHMHLHGSVNCLKRLVFQIGIKVESPIVKTLSIVVLYLTQTITPIFFGNCSIDHIVC